MTDTDVQPWANLTLQHIFQHAFLTTASPIKPWGMRVHRTPAICRKEHLLLPHSPGTASYPSGRFVLVTFLAAAIKLLKN